MFQRLGLVGRLVAILLVLLIVLGLGGIAVEYVARGQDTGGGPRIPLPDQIAAIVDVLERSGDERRALVLRAVNSEQLKVGLDSARPGWSQGRRMPVAEWVVAHYLEVLPARDVEVRVLPDPDRSPLGPWVSAALPSVGLPLRIVVPLRTGEFAVFETRGAPTQRVFGLPTGFWIGVLGAILGFFAIVAIARETKPLVDLAGSVQRFGSEARPAPVTPRGAPDVKTLIVAVNTMQRRIAAMVQGRTILLGAVSHDLKTYITRLRLRVEELPSDEQRDKAIRDLDEMTELIESAIAVARGGAAVAAHESVDIATLLEQVVAARDGDLIVLRTPSVPMLAAGDAFGLRRAFANLLDNGLRYGTRCNIDAGARDGRVEIVFDDDGPGIPEAERAVVFEPFYRAEASRNRETGGSGLGLAIVRQIIDAHRGSIEIADAPMGGARFRVSLPAAGSAIPSPP